MSSQWRILISRKFLLGLVIRIILIAKQPSSLPAYSGLQAHVGSNDRQASKSAGCRKRKRNTGKETNAKSPALKMPRMFPRNLSFNDAASQTRLQRQLSATNITPGRVGPCNGLRTNAPPTPTPFHTGLDQNDSITIPRTHALVSPGTRRGRQLYSIKIHRTRRTYRTSGNVGHKRARQPSGCATSVDRRDYLS